MAQQTDYDFEVPPSPDFDSPFTVGIHSGARTVVGPYDLDGDGRMEVLVSDYTGGGRVHVIENVGVDTWELVYSSPVLDSTATTFNIRAITAGDLDDDGFGEFMFLSGTGFSDTNPNIGSLPFGLYVFEFTGTDNDYGDAPASVFDFPEDTPDRWRAEQMSTFDVDGDGFEELLFGNNGGNNRYDNWFVISVTGDIGSGFETWVIEARFSSRASEDFDPVNRGGGSPYGMIAADLNGDGIYEIAMQSWNYYNFTNAQAVAPDTYVAPGDGDPGAFLQSAFPDDHVAFFGCVAVDIDGNGDDEVFCPNLQTNAVSVLNYEDGEDPLSVTADNVVVGLIPGLSGLGLTAGDLDDDGNMELIGTGPSYTNERFQDGQAPVWMRIAEFTGGDVEDPANYSVQDISFPDDFEDDFDLVQRDSSGVMTEFMEDGIQGPEFASKFAYLGDVDGDGWNELAFGMQGVDDSTFVYNETFNPADSTYTRTTASSEANENRVFMRVVSGNGLAVSIEEDRIVLPSDYRLSPNYPNPFNPSTAFTFTLPIDKQVSVRIYDVLGRVVRTLVDSERYSAGTHQAVWDGRSDAGTQVASGTYLYTLEYGNFRQARTMLLVK